MKKVAILMGSKSDESVMQASAEVLDYFGVAYETHIMSAHRDPEKVTAFVTAAESSGFAVIIAGAGMAAHLAGVVAAQTTIPVIGVPLDASPLNGVDALYSIVQMPPGIPVATVAIGKSGAKNAGILATQILALQDNTLAEKLRTFRKNGSQLPR